MKELENDNEKVRIFLQLLLVSFKSDKSIANFIGIYGMLRTDGMSASANDATQCIFD